MRSKLKNFNFAKVQSQLTILTFCGALILSACSDDDVAGVQAALSSSSSTVGQDTIVIIKEGNSVVIHKDSVNLCSLVSQKGFKLSGLSSTEYWLLEQDGQNYITQDSAFEFNSQEKLVLSNSQIPILGRLYDSLGVLSGKNTIVQIHSYKEISPQKSGEVYLSGNLNPNVQALGSVLQTKAFYHRAFTTEDMGTFFNSSGQSLNIKDGDKITISAMGSADKVLFYVDDPAQVVMGTSFHTYSQFVSALDAFLNGYFGAIISNSMSKPGTLELTPGGMDVVGLQISSNNPLSNNALQNAFYFPYILNNSGVKYSDALLSPATELDILDEVYDQNGQSLGLKNGDQISVSGVAGQGSGVPIRTITFISNNPPTPTATTMGHLIDLIREQLHLPSKTAELYPQNSVEVNPGGSQDAYTDGAIVIRGQAGDGFAISGLNIEAADFTQVDGSPTAFNSNTMVTQMQTAQALTVIKGLGELYDDLGVIHPLEIKLIHSNYPNQWVWEAAVKGNEKLLSGYRGKLSFNSSGTLNSFYANDSSALLKIDPQNGAGLMNIHLNALASTSFKGLTQYNAASQVQVISQNAHTYAYLKAVKLDSVGLLWGDYSNGSRAKLAQLIKATPISNTSLISAQNSFKTNISNLSVLESKSIKPFSLESSFDQCTP